MSAYKLNICLILLIFNKEIYTLQDNLSNKQQRVLLVSFDGFRYGKFIINYNFQANKVKNLNIFRLYRKIRP